MRGRRAARKVADTALPTTAYLMEGDRCSRDCAFCPQARTASSRDDLLARVNWPEVGRPAAGGAALSAAVGEEEAVGYADQGFWDGLCRAADDRQLRRACFQLTASPGVLSKVEGEVRRLHALRPDLPICVSVAARDIEEIGRILGWGAERVTLALDAATPDLHREHKGGSLEARLSLLRQAGARFPGRIGTHLIAGLGENEKELVELVGLLHGAGVTVALFAFTPIPGTRLAGRKPPDLGSYRRIQAARQLISEGQARAADMTFDEQGRLSSYGRPWEEVRAALAGGEGFRTSGCPDCNRPYYNERPSGPLYNYPRRLTAAEAAAAIEEARPVSFGSSARRVNLAPHGHKTRRRSAWRLIVEDAPRSGAENMAVDEAILLAHAAGEAPPTLRFYRWDPPAVSVGYFQDYATDVDPAVCREEGVDIVRRPTGGRAVLHDKEVTYSVVVSTDRLPGAVVETYRLIAEGLVRGLRDLGLEADLAPERGGRGGAGDRAEGGVAGVPDGACFEAPSSYEILAGGRKVVGSAQVRRDGVILQHGSIPLELDSALLARTLGLGPRAAARIAAKAAGLGDVRPGGVPIYAEVCRAVTRGIGESLEVEFAPGGLTPGETATAERLVREKYGRETWNQKRPPKREREEDSCST